MKISSVFQKRHTHGQHILIEAWIS